MIGGYYNNVINPPTRAFSLLTCGFELVACGTELVTRGSKLETRRFELVTRGFELVTRTPELVTPGLLFHVNLFFASLGSVCELSERNFGFTKEIL